MKSVNKLAKELKTNNYNILKAIIILQLEKNIVVGDRIIMVDPEAEKKLKKYFKK